MIWVQEPPKSNKKIEICIFEVVLARARPSSSASAQDLKSSVLETAISHETFCSGVVGASLQTAEGRAEGYA